MGAYVMDEEVYIWWMRRCICGGGHTQCKWVDEVAIPSAHPSPY
jgi:hypothetical protein